MSMSDEVRTTSRPFPPKHKPPLIVYAGLIGSIVSLFFGILIGLSALAGNNGFPSYTALSSDLSFHPDIMVFGVLGGLLITEKLASMEGFMLFNRFRISRPTILSLYAGVILVCLGILYGNSYARYAGLLLVMIASILFFHYLTSPKSHGRREIRWVFGAATAAIFFSAISNSEVTIPASVHLTYLVLLFPIIYILAERIELGFIRGMKNAVISLEVILAWLAVLTGFISTQFPLAQLDNIAMYLSISFLSMMIVLSIRYDPAFHKTRIRGRFETYMRTGIIVSYFWLIIGVILFAFRASGTTGILDPATHAIALGFIGTFIVSHSPIIFPLVLGKKANQNRVVFLPLIVITIANAMRVFGDLGSLISKSLSLISYLSGYILIIAVIAFIFNLRRITLSPTSSTVT